MENVHTKLIGTKLYKAIDYLKVRVYVLIEQQEKVLGRNCDFELKNGPGFYLRDLIAVGPYRVSSLPFLP